MSEPKSPDPGRTRTARRWLDGLLLAVVTVLGAVPRVRRLGATEGFAWDESYYVPAGQAYRTGEFAVNFEHPPLAKWAIAAGIEILGDEPVGWRLAAVIAGITTVPLTWLLIRRILHSPWWATFGASLAAVDGMLIVQSRTAILDSLLPPLVVGAALCLVVHLDRHPSGRLTPWTMGAGFLLGTALAVKWQAGSALAGVAIAFVVVHRRDRRAVASAVVAFVAVPLAVYVSSYAAHFADGLGVGEWVELQRSMVDYHREFRVDHPRDSSPLTWLWLQRPVSYGSLHAPGRISITMALGNPALWWSFLLALPFLVVTWWRGRDRTVEVVLLAFASLFLPWLVILRPGFLYYLTPLVPFMAVGVTWAAREATHRWRLGWLAPAVVGIAALAAFWAYLPIWTYQEISEDRFDALMLFDGWEP